MPDTYTQLSFHLNPVLYLKISKMLISFLRESMDLETKLNPFNSAEGFPAGLAVKNLHAIQETCIQSLGKEDPLEKEMATHSNILAWEIQWTEEPGGS